jgi:hypothetical protein
VVDDDNGDKVGAESGDKGTGRALESTNDELLWGCSRRFFIGVVLTAEEGVEASADEKRAASAAAALDAAVASERWRFCPEAFASSVAAGFFGDPKTGSAKGLLSEYDERGFTELEVLAFETASLLPSLGSFTSLISFFVRDGEILVE